MFAPMRAPLVVGKPLPKAPSYTADKQARAFWRSSYRCGRDYARELDAHGKPMLWAHEREQPESYARRQLITKPRNHAGPVIRRYNDFLYRGEISRPDADEAGELYSQLVTDINGSGTPLDMFMRLATGVAQVDRETYLLADSNKAEDSTVTTKAQAQSAGVRPIARRIDADAVYWSYVCEGVLLECVVALVDENGRTFARWYDETSVADIEVEQPTETNGKTLKVISYTPAKPHGYVGCPMVILRPLFDQLGDDTGESQIHPLAESQQAIFNYLSLLNEETFNICFSQIVATGVSADEVKDVPLGSLRLLCLPNPDAKFEVMGADPAQAESIRTNIANEERELYRVAGVSSGDPTAGPSAPESGVAKAFRFNDLAANLSALSKAAENAENALLARIYSAQSETLPGLAKYPVEFDLPELADDLTNVIRVLSVTQLPDVIKKHLIRRFADRDLALSEDEDAELDAELAAFETPDPTDPPLGGSGGFGG